MYGYQDSGELAPGKQGGVFGKNTGVVNKFEYNPNGGKDNAAQDCIDFTVQIGEFEYRKRFFPVSKVYSDGGGEITDTSSEEYKEEFAKTVDRLNATLSDIVTCFVTEEQLKTALSTPISNFKDFAQILDSLVKSNPNWNKEEVDVFLQYSWAPANDKTVTYPGIPTDKSIKHGTWICKSKGTGYKEVRTETSLKYINEAGEEHPFKRGKWFVESNFSNQINLESTGTAAMAGGTSTTASW